METTQKEAIQIVKLNKLKQINLTCFTLSMYTMSNQIFSPSLIMA